MLERFKKSDVNLVQANISQSSFSKPSDGGRGGFNGHRGREVEILVVVGNLGLILIDYNVNCAVNLSILYGNTFLYLILLFRIPQDLNLIQTYKLTPLPHHHPPFATLGHISQLQPPS